MADLVILSGAYLLVYALVRLGDWYTHDTPRLVWEMAVYMTATLVLTWWYASLFVTIIPPGVAIATPVLLAGVVLGAWYLRRLRHPLQLREDLYVTVRLTDISAPAWRTVAVQPFTLLWQNVVLVSALLILLQQGWSIWFILGAFLMTLALLGIGMRVWRDVAWYAPWLIFTFTLPALIYVILFFPFGFLWLLVFQVVAYVGLHAEVELYRILEEE